MRHGVVALRITRGHEALIGPPHVDPVPVDTGVRGKADECAVAAAATRDAYVGGLGTRERAHDGAGHAVGHRPGHPFGIRVHSDRDTAHCAFAPFAGRFFAGAVFLAGAVSVGFFAGAVLLAVAVRLPVVRRALGT